MEDTISAVYAKVEDGKNVFASHDNDNIGLPISQNKSRLSGYRTIAYKKLPLTLPFVPHQKFSSLGLDNRFSAQLGLT